MKTFKQFISEAQFDDIDAAVDEILHHCGPFLHESRRKGFLQRGMQGLDLTPWDDKSVPYVIKKVNKERVPRRGAGLNAIEHKVVDDFLHDKLGIRGRSQAMFCIGQSEKGTQKASQFGTPYIVFPIGDFKYVWSPEVFDIFGQLHYKSEDPEEQKKEIETWLKGKKYRTTGLDQAVKSANEIMIDCETYYVFSKYMWAHKFRTKLGIGL